MCVTTEVNHQVKLPPALNALVEREKAEMRKFIEGAAAQWMPRQNQQAAYVSRLQCVQVRTLHADPRHLSLRCIIFSVLTLRLIQTSVQSQIAKLRTEAPHTRVAIVLFNSEVVVIGDGSQTPVTLAGDVLSDYEGLMGRGSGFSAFQRSVAESHKDLGAFPPQFGVRHSLICNNQRPRSLRLSRVALQRLAPPLWCLPPSLRTHLQPRSSSVPVRPYCKSIHLFCSSY